MTPPKSWPNILAPLADIETARLSLRRFQIEDVDLLAPVFAKPQVWMFPYGRGFTKVETEIFVRTQIAEWERCGFGCWLATHKESQRAIGYVGISVPHFLPDILPAVEVGWRFDPDFWGMGYATEGAVVALAEGFATLGLEKICSAPQTENPPSRRVCDRLGMSLERVAIAEATPRRGPVEIGLYWITREAWLQRPPIARNE